LWIAEDFGCCASGWWWNEVRVYGLKHQKEKRSMHHFAGLDVSVKKTSVCVPKTSSNAPDLAGIRWFAWRRL